jgi:hypothetical protein
MTIIHRVVDILSEAMNKSFKVMAQDDETYMFSKPDLPQC